MTGGTVFAILLAVAVVALVLFLDTTRPSFIPPANGGVFGPNWNCPYFAKGPALVCYYKKPPEKQPPSN